MDGYALPVSFDAMFDDHGQPRVYLDLEVSEVGRVECKRFELRATETCPAVTPRHLRTVGLSDLRDRAIQLAASPVAGKDGEGIVLKLSC
jgi:hypothetical protein